MNTPANQTEPRAGHAGSLRVALLQMDIQMGDPDANYARLAELLEEAADREQPDVILCPEMWNTGYALDRIHELADAGGERTREMISAFCRRRGIQVVAGSIASRTGEQIRNTILVFGRDGQEIADYSKVHLFRLMQEEKHLTAGDKLGRFNLGQIPSGMMICYDIRFPELSRRLALDGAQMLFVPAEWPKPRLHHWRTLLTARAIENQMYVVACNRVGTSGETSFFGHSMVIDPWGEILVEGTEEEQILAADLDLELVAKVRRTIPVFEDRRPLLY